MVERGVRGETGAWESSKDPEGLGAKTGDPQERKSCRRDRDARPHGRKLAEKSFVNGSKELQRIEEVLKSGRAKVNGNEVRINRM